MKYLISIALILTIVSCERQIPLKKFDFEKKLVINSYNSAGQPIKAFVGSSVNSVQIPELDDARGDAVVLLKENGFTTFFDTVIVHDGTIQFPITTKLGKVYQLEVQMDDYPVIQARDSVPSLLPEFEIDTLIVIGNSYRTQFTVTDVPDNTKYMLELFVIGKEIVGSDTTDISIPMKFTSGDRVFVTNINTLSTPENYALFDDKLFRGSNKQIEVIANQEEWSKPNFIAERLEVKLSCISNTMFQYYLGLLENNHIYGGPLATYSLNNGNVDGGLGIFCFTTSRSRTTKLY
jgi:hypothetical protein